MWIVYKWQVPIDGETHEIGAGRVVHVEKASLEDDFITVWTQDPYFPADVGNPDSAGVILMNRRAPFKVVGTGQSFHDSADVVGSVRDGVFIWHVIRFAIPGEERHW